MSNESANYWKFATIGILLVGATVAATLLVTGRDSGTEVPDSQKVIDASPTVAVEDTTKSGTSVKLAEEVVPVEPQRNTRVAKSSRSTSGAVPPPPTYSAQAGHPPQPAYPSQAVMEACNNYANEKVSSKTEEVVKNAVLGAAIGAAIGAAGGAIAGGGSGAGKGAAIGGVTGVAGGSLYGLNETKSHDAQYQAAYASCMRSKGF